MLKYTALLAMTALELGLAQGISNQDERYPESDVASATALLLDISSGSLRPEEAVQIEKL